VIYVLYCQMMMIMMMIIIIIIIIIITTRTLNSTTVKCKALASSVLRLPIIRSALNTQLTQKSWCYDPYHKYNREKRTVLWNFLRNVRSIYGMQAILNQWGWEPLFRHTLPRRLRPSASPKGSQTDWAPTTLRFVSNGRRWTHFKSIVILSEEHDR